MEREELDHWRRAGALARRARDYGEGLLRPGTPLLDIAEGIETFIREQGGDLAFPVNLALNNVAAHWTPSPRETGRLQAGDLVKLDVGVHIDGYIGDTALTVEVGGDRHREMCAASREALAMVIDLAAPGVSVGLLGRAVQETIEGFGFRPIANLTGHGVRRYNLHSGLSIPNVAERGGTVLRRGDVIAVEPFATDGAGRVGGRRNSNIYRLRQVRRVRDPDARELLAAIQERYRGLPFSERDLRHLHPSPREPLQQLLRRGAVQYYPVLEELGHGLVTQREHTLLLTNGGVEVLTR